MSKKTEAKPAGTPRRDARRQAYLQGALVFIALAVLTAAEFAIALATDGWIGLLFLTSLVKAGLIVVYYMHVKSVWSKEAHG
jgi:hypothetical protein